jgi:hypothetical protein
MAGERRRQSAADRGPGQVLHPSVVEIEGLERGVAQRAHVEWEVAGPAPLGQALLFVGCGDAHRRAHFDPDPSLVTHRGIERRLDDDRDQLASIEDALLDGHRRQREDVAVVSHVRKVAQQFVLDGERGALPSVGHADQDDARVAVAGQIVREGANIAPDPAAIRTGRLALD